MNEWRRNLILGRDYYGIRDGNGNGLRNDDGASYYKHSHNIIYRTGMQFNGGTQIHTFDNLFLHGGACSFHIRVRLGIQRKLLGSQH